LVKRPKEGKEGRIARMLCRAFTFLTILLLALQKVFPFHRR
jgi:hypothetical protein